jgi:serine/threonine protein kinase/WD40 repeat protein
MPDARTACPSPELLADYSLGRLLPRQLAAVHDHVAACAECRRKVESLPPDSFVGQIKAAIPKAASVLPTPPPDSSSPELPRAQAPVPADVPAELAGSGKFEVVGLLGRGGMGAVYKARHAFLGEMVAIKVMNADKVGNPAARARFLREMQAVGQLKHANIVRALDAEQMGGLLVLVMEYVPGVALDRLVKQRGPLPVAFACRCVAQAALGLQHAHEKGLVHRDIKPGNLMISARDHEVKLLDFGLVRGLPVQSGSNQTQVDAFMGTPDFCAPEQASDARGADVRADIYSLGCTLYYLLAGRPPFRKSTLMDTILAHVQEEPQPVTALRPDVPAGLWAVLAKMLAKKPADRYQTPIEVAKALQPFAPADAKPAAPAPPGVPPHGKPGRPGGDTDAIKGPARQPEPRDKRGDAAKKTKERPAWGRRSPAREGIAAAALVLVACLLAAIVVRVKVRTPDGEAVIVLEIDQPGAEVSVDGSKIDVTVPGEDRPVEIKAEPGLRTLRIAREGFVAITREVELTVGKSKPIRVRLEPVKTVAVKPPAPPKPVQEAPRPRRSWASRNGTWKKEGNELVQEEVMPDCQLAFGDFAWTDYDFSCEGSVVWGNGEIGLNYRVSGTGNAQFVLGRYDRTWESATSIERGNYGRLQERRTVALQAGAWYRLKVRLRGEHCECFLNEQPVFAFDDAKNPRGAVGLWMWSTAARFRNLRVTDPAGKVLFEGLPDLPPARSEWPPTTGPPSANELHCLRGHGCPVRCVAFTRDGRRVLSGSDGGTGKTWPDGKTGKTFYHLNPASTIRLWDVQTGRQLSCSPLDVPGGARPFVKLALAPRGNRFLTVMLADSFANGKRVQDWSTEGDRIQLRHHTFFHSPGLIDATFTPDGTKALAVGETGSLWEEDLDNKIRVRHVPASIQGVTCAAIAPDGQTVLLARRDQPFVEIDLTTGKETGRWTQPAGFIRCMAFSPDGKLALCGGEGGAVRLWDVASAKQLRLVASHNRPVRAVALSADGRRALFGGDDNTVRLWDVELRKELASFTGHTSGILAVAFSPDGKQAASASADYTVRLWRLPP